MWFANLMVICFFIRMCFDSSVVECRNGIPETLVEPDIFHHQLRIHRAPFSKSMTHFGLCMTNHSLFTVSNNTYINSQKHDTETIKAK